LRYTKSIGAEILIVHYSKKITMKKIIFLFVLSAGAILQAQAQTTILDLAAASKEHSTLVQAVKAAELTEILKEKGPYTLFAPANSAFDKIPQDVLANLLKPEGKKDLSSILAYHLVTGSFTTAALNDAIVKGNGVYVIQTLNGGSLTATLENGKIKLTDAVGGVSFVTNSDIKASNGFIHVTDKVLMPK
jgi:uncharacterized surface protein with fasciclin (FAS1) repeats